MHVENYSERVHMARTHELASESQRNESRIFYDFNSITFSLHVYTLKNAMEGLYMLIPGISSPDRHFIWPHFM